MLLVERCNAIHVLPKSISTAATGTLRAVQPVSCRARLARRHDLARRIAALCSPACLPFETTICRKYWSEVGRMK